MQTTHKAPHTDSTQETEEFETSASGENQLELTVSAASNMMITWQPRNLKECKELLSFEDMLSYIYNHYNTLFRKAIDNIQQGEAGDGYFAELDTGFLAELNLENNPNYGQYIRIIREFLGHLQQCKQRIRAAISNTDNNAITEAKQSLHEQLNIHSSKLNDNWGPKSAVSALNHSFWKLFGYDERNTFYEIASQLVQQVKYLLDEEADLQQLTLTAFNHKKALSPVQTSVTQPLVVGMLGRIQQNQQLLALKVSDLQDEIDLGKQVVTNLKRQMAQTKALGDKLARESRKQQDHVAENARKVAELKAKQEQEMRLLLAKVEAEKQRDNTISSELSKFLSASQIKFFKILYQALLENTDKDEESILTEVIEWFIEHAVEVTSAEVLTQLNGESEAITDIKTKIRTAAHPQEQAELVANKQSFQDYIKEYSLNFTHQTFATAIFYSLACDGSVAPGDEGEAPGLLFPEHLALRRAIYQSYQTAQAPDDAASTAANSPYRTPQGERNQDRPLSASKLEPKRLFMPPPKNSDDKDIDLEKQRALEAEANLLPAICPSGK